jgi:hypothetical protein
MVEVLTSESIKGTPLSSQVGGAHYKNFAIQPIEFCQRNRLTPCQFAVIKYICRHDMKNGIQDLEKAIHFVLILAQLEYPDQVAALEAKVAEMLSVIPYNGLQVPPEDLAAEIGDDAEMHPANDNVPMSLRDAEDLQWIVDHDIASESSDSFALSHVINKRHKQLLKRWDDAKETLIKARSGVEVALDDLEAFSHTFGAVLTR